MTRFYKGARIIEFHHFAFLAPQSVVGRVLDVRQPSRTTTIATSADLSEPTPQTCRSRFHSHQVKTLCAGGRRPDATPSRRRSGPHINPTPGPSAGYEAHRPRWRSRRNKEEAAPHPKIASTFPSKEKKARSMSYELC